MSDRMEIIPAGSLLTVSTGEYSDYSVHGVFRAVKDIDASQLLDEWIAAHPEEEESYCFEYGNFLADVVRQGLLEPIESWEWHLADYFRHTEMSVAKQDGYQP